jgi:adenylate cyclase
VEGSIRKVGNRVRIAAQLIDAARGAHLWAERYDRELEDIFSVQDEVVQIVVAAVAGRVEMAGAQVAKRKPPESLVAYEDVLRGMEQLSLIGEEHNPEARRACSRRRSSWTRNTLRATPIRLLPSTCSGSRASALGGA